MERDIDEEVLRKILTHKWWVSILREVGKRPARLAHLQRTIPGASKKMLIDSLHTLQDLGWIDRTEFDSAVRHVEYRLAPATSEKIQDVLKLLSSAS